MSNDDFDLVLHQMQKLQLASNFFQFQSLYLHRSPGYPYLWLTNNKNNENTIKWAQFVLKWHQYMSPMKVYMAASIVSNELKGQMRSKKVERSTLSTTVNPISEDSIIDSSTTENPKNATALKNQLKELHLLRVN